MNRDDISRLTGLELSRAVFRTTRLPECKCEQPRTDEDGICKSCRRTVIQSLGDITRGYRAVEFLEQMIEAGPLSFRASDCGAIVCIWHVRGWRIHYTGSCAAEAALRCLVHGDQEEQRRE
jgi:hypothetical protein